MCNMHTHGRNLMASNSQTSLESELMYTASYQKKSIFVEQSQDKGKGFRLPKLVNTEGK
jgi:hypothetical protein